MPKRVFCLISINSTSLCGHRHFLALEFGGGCLFPFCWSSNLRCLVSFVFFCLFVLCFFLEELTDFNFSRSLQLVIPLLVIVRKTIKDFLEENMYPRKRWFKNKKQNRYVVDVKVHKSWVYCSMNFYIHVPFCDPAQTIHRALLASEV